MVGRHWDRGPWARDSGWTVCSCRTARANNPGMVLTFVLPTEQSHLHTIEELLRGGENPVLSSYGTSGPAVVMAAPPAHLCQVFPSCSILIPP